MAKAKTKGTAVASATLSTRSSIKNQTSKSVKRKSAPIGNVEPLTKKKKAARKEVLEDEPTDSDDNESASEQSEDDRTGDNDAARFCDEEAPQIMSQSEAEGSEDESVARKTHQRLSRLSRSSSLLSFPLSDNDGPISVPHTDTEAGLTDTPDEDDRSSPPLYRRDSDSETVEKPKAHSRTRTKTRKSTRKTAEKLRDELPQVTNETLPMSRVSNRPTIPVAQAPVLAPTPPPPPPPPSSLATPSTTTSIPYTWLSHTAIITTAKGRSFELDTLKQQNRHIRKILDRSFKIGKLYMLSDDEHCPVNDELKNIAFGALVQACRQLGYAGGNDVLGRLEAGDYESYIKPIVHTAYHRIGLERKDLKLTQMSTVLAAYGLVNDAAGRAQALGYVTQYTYSYGTLPSGEYDTTKPFEHSALPTYIGAMFFGAHPYATIIANNKHIFKSSIASKPDELELPKGMVALSVAAIHSILSDFARQCKENFPSKELAGVWQTAIAILENIEQVNKNRYHNLMHGLYLKSSGTLPLAKHGLTNQQIFDLVDWSALADDQN
ncbi:hypothetical protein K435DRAFT_858949 [Dendrothele bispora CBS 962.96]|uniref:DUF6532 domain-containing protein n=1 Tax=Dendrothele bispora (strain CBS 962.96) TaxID=1314807 RepID=A0A4S8M1T3_DENBC|nr:hypothetical protein K435DRAFT_858949 [Dendrothele bispora CBS 962.96]